MKNLILLFAGLAFAFIPSDDCSLYYPSKEGTQLVIKTYSDKDKLTSTVKQKITAVETTAQGRTVEIHSEAFDKKDKQVGSSDYSFSCEGGSYFMDMKSMVSAEQMETTKDMKLSVEADKLEIPASPQVGQTLKDGTINMVASTEGSAITFKFITKVSNRKIAAIEDVTVPAGTFKCVKITYDVEVKNVFTVRMKGADWYAKDVGMVRGETYNNNGKLQSYSVLDSKN